MKIVSRNNQSLTIHSVLEWRSYIGFKRNPVQARAL
jgi:hypothetical protein